jgi:hypothetical protein
MDAATAKVAASTSTREATAENPRSGLSGDEEQGMDRDPDQGADHGAVDPNELEIPSQLRFETV